MRIHSLTLASLAVLSVSALAQQPAPALTMGTVPTHDALVTGGLQVHGERADLVSNASVTAYDRTAAISLVRGGEILVCATTQFHLLHSGTGDALLFGLDRGAFEIHSASQPQDIILTPDIRFTLEAPGRFDLRLRVTTNGDTCVENAGASAPVLLLNDAFSDASSYRLIAGQHVLFEHGNLRQVVDNERSPCGCPQPAPAPSSVAANGSPAAQAAAQHPFPAAASEGLASTPPPLNSPPGEKQTQVATTFSYVEGAPPPPSTQPAPPAANAVSPAPVPGASSRSSSTTTAEPPPTPPGAHDLAHAIGRFFHKLFHPKS